MKTHTYKILLNESQSKEGESAIDNSDWSVAKQTKNGLVVAVADGATQGVMNKEWSHILAESFIDQDDQCFDSCVLSNNDNLHAIIDSARLKWKEKRDEKVKAKNHQLFESEYLWLFKRGSYSTILCLQIIDSTYTAIAFGDTCLFHLHKNELAASFPIATSGGFNDTPLLISSLASDLEKKSISGYPNFLSKQGNIEHGDLLFIMTDALSAWFLKETEDKKKPWKKLEDLIKDSKNYDAFISELREKPKLVNHETTAHSKSLFGINIRGKVRKPGRSDTPFLDKPRLVNDDMTLVVIG